MASTTILNDAVGNFSGNLSGHNATVTGNTYTSVAGTMTGDNAGGFYASSAGFPNYYTSGTYTSGIIQAQVGIKVLSNIVGTQAGIFISDPTSNNGYTFSFGYNNTTTNGDWRLTKVANAGSGATTNMVLSDGPIPVVGDTYTLYLSYFITLGTTVQLTFMLTHGGVIVWAGTTTDTFDLLCTRWGPWAGNAATVSTGYHFTSLLGTDPGTAFTATAPNPFTVNGPTQTVTIAGTGTTYVPGTPGSPVYTISPGSAAGQVVASTTALTFTATPPTTNAQNGWLIVTDPSSGFPQPLPCGIPTTDSGYHFSAQQQADPSGLGMAGVNYGTYWKLGLTSTNESHITCYYNAANATSTTQNYIRTVSSGMYVSSFTSINGPTVNTIQIGKPAGIGEIQGYLSSGVRTQNCWGTGTFNPPQAALRLQCVVAPGCTTITPPSLIQIGGVTQRMLIYSDSLGTGYNAIAVTDSGTPLVVNGGDTLLSFPFLVAQAFGLEPDHRGFGGQGLTLFNVNDNPALYKITTGAYDDTNSSWNKNWASQSALVSGSFPQTYQICLIEQGGNDWNSNSGGKGSTAGGVAVQAALYSSPTLGLLPALRAALLANSPNCWIFVIPTLWSVLNNQSYQTYQAAAVAAYTAATGDNRVAFIANPLTPIQQDNISQSTNGVGLPSFAGFMSLDLQHMNPMLHAYAAPGISRQMQAIMAPSTPSGAF